MPLASLRSRVHGLAVLFAFLLVGAVFLTTYFVVGEAMVREAEEESADIASRGADSLRMAITQAQLDAAAAGLTGQEATAWVREAVLDAVQSALARDVRAHSAFAVYDGEELVWASSDRAVLDTHSTHRAAAVESGRAVDIYRSRVLGLTGLVAPADLGEHVVHVPIELPDGTQLVLDASYVPRPEEAAIDRIRPYMTGLAVVAIALAIAMMQFSTGWVLHLIEDLRKAADSIQAGELDVRLPEEGRHEVSALARSVNGLLERLRARADAQTRFVADASHELATPVAGIRGYVNILRAWGADDPDVRDEAIGAIDRESRRMVRLCADLLSLIKSERLREGKAVRMELNAVARQALASAATTYIDKRLVFEGPEEGDLYFTGDPDRIAQLMNILVDNAAKYTDGEGSVSLRTWRRLDSVFFEVADTGVGISAQELPHIFERFYRSDESRSRRPGGFGLGLSIAKRIVELSGGHIQVDSVEGVGTHFTVRLPRHQSQQ